MTAYLQRLLLSVLSCCQDVGREDTIIMHSMEIQAVEPSGAMEGFPCHGEAVLKDGAASWHMEAASDHRAPPVHRQACVRQAC